MDVREKLVELLGKAKHEFWCSREKYNGAEFVACYLISNGVTVQDSKVVEIDQFTHWVSVKERLPQENEPECAICEQVQVLLDNGFVSTGWCNRHTKMWWHLDYGKTSFIGYDYDHTPVIAWQPLAQPPKGE